ALTPLARYRPVSQPVGAALEAAAAKDASWRVRLQARTTLVSYHLAGYHAAKKTEPVPQPAIAPAATLGRPAPVVNAPKTSEPPLAIPPAPGGVPNVVPTTPAPTTWTRPPQTTPVTDAAQPMPPRTAEPPPQAPP